MPVKYNMHQPLAPGDGKKICGGMIVFMSIMSICYAYQLDTNYSPTETVCEVHDFTITNSSEKSIDSYTTINYNVTVDLEVSDRYYILSEDCLQTHKDCVEWAEETEMFPCWYYSYNYITANPPIDSTGYYVAGIIFFVIGTMSICCGCCENDSGKHHILPN